MLIEDLLFWPQVPLPKLPSFFSTLLSQPLYALCEFSVLEHAFKFL